MIVMVIVLGVGVGVLEYIVAVHTVFTFKNSAAIKYKTWLILIVNVTLNFHAQCSVGRGLFVVAEKIHDRFPYY